MTNQQYAADELFEAVLDLPQDARPSFLNRACKGEPTLRRSIEHLLAMEQRLGDFLAAPACRMAQGSPGSGLSIGSSPGLSSATSCAYTASVRPARASAPHFGPNDIIAGRFQVVRYIAGGGMGEVYEARDQFLQGDNIALKIIRPDMAAEPGASYRFEREVILARKAHHPNLCPIYDMYRCSQSTPVLLFLTMKLLHGETLRELLQRGEKISLADAVEISNQLISGVAAMHEAGIIHRDLKPGNIMVERTAQWPRVSIMDFGLARSHDAVDALIPWSAGATRAYMAGTPGYIAPEMLRGASPSKSTDLFALGVILHLVLTGERPVTRLSGSPETHSAALRHSGAPGYLAEVAEGLLSADPELRCRTFEGLWPTRNCPF